MLFLVGALQVVRHWRSWAPAKRAKRRKLRDVQAALSCGERRRIWRVLRDYTVKRRAGNKLKMKARQNYRWAVASQVLHDFWWPAEMVMYTANSPQLDVRVQARVA